jgi:hypothetical protein
LDEVNASGVIREWELVDGIDAVRIDSHVVVLIREFTPAVEGLIRERLAAFCYGRDTVSKSTIPSYFSFARTASEFVLRFDRQSLNTRIGMVGEFLTHLVIEDLFNDLTNFSVFLNKEERSIKKGFDLTFIGGPNASIWYAEVKSTAIESGTANSKARSLLSTASSDLGSKLASRDRRSLWDSAQVDAKLALDHAGSQTVRELLQLDSLSAESGTLQRASVVLSAAVVQKFDVDEIQLAELISLLSTLEKHEQFDEVRFIAIQKSTIDRVIEFFRSEAAS